MGISISHDEIENISINQDIFIEAEIESISGEVTTALVYYKDYFNDWNSMNLVNCLDDGINYCATISGFNIETIFFYYFYIENSVGQSAILPYAGSNNPFNIIIGELPIIIQDDLESEADWIISDTNDNATSGIWEYGNPNGVFVQSQGLYSQPEDDYSVNGENCFITGNSIGNGEGYDDVDGGVTTLVSPIYNLNNSAEIIFDFALWFSNNLGDNPGSDNFIIEFRENSDSNWFNFFSTNTSTYGWELKTFYLSDYMDEFEQIQFRFIVSDLYFEGDNGSGGSLVESAIDGLRFRSILLNDILLGDANLDGNIDVTDVIFMVNFILSNVLPDENMINNSDIDEDGFVTIIDIVSVVNIILN